MPAVKDYWPFVLNNLKKSLSQSNFQAWFSGVEFVSTENNGRKLLLSVPSSFSKKYIENKFKKDLKEAVNKYLPQVIHIDISVTENISGKSVSQQEFFPLHEGVSDIKQKVAQIKKQNLDLMPDNLPKENINNLNPKYTFENFVETGNNQLAVNVAKAIIKKPGTLYNPVFLYSGVGLGKTHLLQAIGQKLLDERPDFKIKYTTCEKFFNFFLSGLNNKESSKAFKDYYRNVDILLLDDIQFIAGKEATQEAFFHTFNELHQLNKQIIITSDKSPKSLGRVEERLVSRFEWGIVVDISKPELEDRISVVKDKVARMELPLDMDKITKIAEVVNTNYRDIEGILNRIEARIKLLPAQPLEDYELNKILSGFQNSSIIKIDVSNPNVTPDSLITAVCKIFSVEKNELMGASREKSIALARQMAMYLSKEDLDLSYPTIGKIFKRDHTTALHAWKKINQKLKEDQKLIAKLKAIRSAFSS